MQQQEDVRKQDRKPLGRVNWERGRLLQYQSFRSFAAMFCALNYITPRHFAKYWAHTFGSSSNGDSKWLRLIAHLLREPLAVVTTVFGSVKGHLLAPPGWCISYCSLCVADGFHGRFHDDGLLNRCPIHDVELTREGLAGAPVFERRYQERLRQLFEERNPGWPSNTISVDYADPRKHAKLAAFFEWQASSRSAMTGWGAVELPDEEYSYDYEASHLDILLGRVAWCVAIPEQVVNLLVVKPWLKSPAIYRCHDVLAQEMAHLIEKVGLPLLLWAHKASQLFWNGTASYAQLLRPAIEALQANHERDQCTCTWGTTWGDGYPGTWQRFEKGVIGDYSVLCAHRYAAEELRRDWLEALPKRNRWREQTLAAYGTYIDLMQRSGVAKVIGEVPYEGMLVPLPHFMWSSDVTRLLDVILLALAMAQVDELNEWVAAVDAGMRAPLRDYLPHSVFTLRTKRGIDSVLVWPAGAGRSMGNQEIES